MNELMVVANVAIVFFGVYKFFELFVTRRERMMMIEKLPPEALSAGQVQKPRQAESWSTPLRWGCLLAGLGIGLLVGYVVIRATIPNYLTTDTWHVRETASLIYGACILLGGGAGLLTAFLVEWRYLKRRQD